MNILHIYENIFFIYIFIEFQLWKSILFIREQTNLLTIDRFDIIILTKMLIDKIEHSVARRWRNKLSLTLASVLYAGLCSDALLLFVFDSGWWFSRRGRSSRMQMMHSLELKCLVLHLQPNATMWKGRCGTPLWWTSTSHTVQTPFPFPIC